MRNAICDKKNTSRVSSMTNIKDTTFLLSLAVWEKGREKRKERNQGNLRKLYKDEVCICIMAHGIIWKETDQKPKAK
jgi:hypothetical protein